MRGTNKRIPLLAAILMALLFAAMPETAEAQGALGATTSFNAQTCMQNQANAYINHAQGYTANRVKIFNAAINPDMKLVYCWNTIETIFKSIGALTADSSVLGAFIWTLVINAIESLLNAVCAAVVGAITSAINMLKSLLCIPLPHLSLGFSLGGFGGGSCNGVSLLSLGNATGVRPGMPFGYSPLWNYTPPH